MRIFLTGGTGFIGKFVVKKLDNKENRLLVLSRKPKPSTYSKNVSFLKGNLNNIKKWGEELKNFNPEATVHLAWEGIPDFGVQTSKKNLKASIELIKFLAKIGCRTILATGTLWEYGNRIGKLSENMKLDPFNPFTKAKVSLYLKSKEITKKKNINFIWIRLFYVYGPDQKSSSLIPYLISCVKAKKEPRMRNPDSQNDFIYVEDVAKAIKQILYKCKKSDVFNIGSGKVMNVQYIFKKVLSHFKQEQEYQRATPRQTDKFAASYADISKIKKEIGWKPRVTIDEGIRRMIKSII